MKKILFITIMWLGSMLHLTAQTSASGESGIFTMDTKNPVINLTVPNGGGSYSYFLPLNISWTATDSSFGETPISAGISTAENGRVTWLATEIPNTGSLSLDPPDIATPFAKAHIKAIDAFGNVTVDMSDTYFELLGLNAEFSAEPLSGNLPLSVQFTDLSTGYPTSREWDFGDGSSSALQNPLHIYETAGVYNVSLTIFLNGNSNQNLKLDYITVVNPVPVISFSPEFINFGNVPVNEMASDFITIYNRGSTPLLIDGISSDDPFFAMYSGTIAPGTSQTIEVNFAPQAALYFQGTLIFHTNIGDVGFPVSGTGLPLLSCWQFDLSYWNFGLVDIPTGASQNIAITNCGSQMLSVNAYVTGDDVFAVSPSVFTINPGLTQYVEVSFNPEDISRYNGVLHFSSDAGIYDIILEGNGYYLSTPPQLTFSEGFPFNGTSGVSPALGPPGSYFEYMVIYTDADNDPPMDFYPQVGVDFNGDQDFLDPGESLIGMNEVDPSDFNFMDGKAYSVIVQLPENMLLGYRFFAWDMLGNPALGEASLYHSGPEVSGDLLDLAIYANDITFSDGFPEAGDDVAISAIIRNTSDYLAENVPVNVYIDNVLKYQTVLAAVYPQSSTSISFNYIFPITDYYPVKVVIDEENLLAEDNELNNFAIRPVVVGDVTLPGIIAVSSAINASQVYPNGTLRFYGHASYENAKFRGSNVSGAQVILTIHETGATYSAYTDANGNYSIYFTTPGTPGYYCASVEVTDFTLTGNSEEHCFTVIPFYPDEPGYPDKPDLVIRNWDIEWTGDPVINTQNTVSATFYNTGNLEALDVNVFAYVDGVKSYEASFASLPAGGSQQLSFSTEFSTIGNHNLSFVLDPLHLVDESSESNNVAYASRYIYPPEPDLTPVDMTFSDNSPLAGQAFSITVWVKNLNWTSSTPTSVAFYEGIDNMLGIVPLAEIAGGQTKAVTLTGSTLNISGWHNIRAVVDPVNLVFESNEQNQELTRNIYIEQPLADLSLSYITPSAYDPQTGDPLDFSVVVFNNGSADAENFYVKFTVDGSLAGDLVLVNNLPIGQSLTLTSETWIMQGIPHLVCVIADENNTVEELNEYNNQRCQTFGIDLVPSVHPNYPYNYLGSPLYVLINEPVDLFATIYNSGAFRANQVVISFLLNNDILAKDTISFINGNYSATSSGLVQFDTLGSFTVQVVVDPENALNEINETNNTTPLHVYVYENLPDLYINETMIGLSNYNPEQNELIDVTATWVNQGNIPSGQFVVQLYIDQVFIDDLVIANVEPGDQGNFTWTDIFSSYQIGYHSIKIVLDSENEVREFNENNNVATRYFIVGAAPDFDVTALSISNEDPEPGEIMEISATIGNFGGAAAAATVNFYCTNYNQTIPIGSVNINLPKNGTTIIQTAWLVQLEAGYIIAEVSGANPPEAYLLNNSKQVFFGGELYVANPIADVITDEDFPSFEVADLLHVFKNIDPSAMTFTVLSSTPNIGFELTAGNKLRMSLAANWNGAGTAIVSAHNYYGQIARDTFEILVNPMPDYPDLTPVEITLGESTPFAGYPFDVQVKVKNLNWESSGETTLGIYDGGVELLGTVVLPAIGGGQTAWVTVSGITVAAWGWHTLVAVADPDDLIEETNETNQELSKNIFVRQPLPDLAVFGISASDYLPQPGEPVNFMATVTNNGNAPASSFWVRFTINGSELGDSTLINSLAIGESQIVTSSIWNMETDPKNICVTADGGNQVAELNELNNQNCRMFGIDFQPSKNPYYSTNSPVRRLNILKGQVTQLFGRIYNNGTFRADNAKVSFVINNQVLATDVIPFINGGSSAETTVLYTFHETGNFTLQIIPDFDQEVAETDESNNVVSLFITVYSDLPDLFVASEHIAPSSINPDVNEPISINATYFNQGNVYSGPFTVTLYVDDVFLKDTIVDSVNPDEEASVGWPDVYSTAAQGIHIIKVVLDEENQVGEVNELNNVATRAIIVGNAPDFLLAGIAFSNPVPALGELIEITASIENNGGDDANAMLTVYYLSGNDTILIHSEAFFMMRYSDKEITLPWFAEVEQGVIFAEITGSKPIEVNLDNNSLAQSFGGGIQLISPIPDQEVYVNTPTFVVADLMQVFENVDNTALTFSVGTDKTGIVLEVTADNMLEMSLELDWSGSAVTIVSAHNMYGQQLSDTFNITAIPYPATHDIRIPKGWSGLSSWTIPHNPAIESVFLPVQNQLTILQSMNSLFYPSQNINTIGDWENQAAFKIKVSDTCTLRINGFEEPDKTLALYAGWNLAPVISNLPVDPVQLFEVISTDLKIVKDVAGTGVYWPEYGINSIGDLLPGKAYFVMMNNAGTVTFPANSVKGVKTGDFTNDAEQVSPWGFVIRTPSTHIIALPENASLHFSESSFIGAFTSEGICAGYCHVIKGCSQVLVVNMDDPLTAGKDGFEADEPLSFRIWDAGAGEDATLKVQFNASQPDHSGVFVANGISAISDIQTLNNVQGQFLKKLQLFPNPTHGIVNIAGIEEGTSLKITVSNQTGQQIKMQTMDSDYQVNLEGFTPGLYFIKLDDEQSVRYEKVVLD